MKQEVIRLPGGILLTPPTPPRRFFGAILGLLTLGVGGCGLGEYEEDMLKQQKRLDRLDRENKELVEPLEIPEAAQKYAEEVFLRVPKGVSTTAETANLWSGLFYKYAGGGPFSGLYVAWAGAKDKDFKKKVEGASAFNNARVKHSQYTIDPSPGHKALTLNATTYELPDRTYHLYLSPSEKVAIVYETKNQSKSATDTMNWSLGTLAFGGDALKQRKEYKQRAKATKK